MKKIFFLCIYILNITVFGQTSANRFFYELQYKPKKESPLTDKVITILDVLPEKSIYQDYTIKSQDSAIISRLESLKRFDALNGSSVASPKFTYKIIKTYPSMEITFSDRISKDLLGYNTNEKFDWKVLPVREKVGEYDTQMATTSFGGRKWTAWFTNKIPFQEGPYKFYGLPGLIVKIEDADKNYSWELKGNKKIDNYSELSEVEKMISSVGGGTTTKITTKEKFDEAYNNYKENPMAEFKTQIPPEMMNYKVPGSDMSIGEKLKQQEESYKQYFNANNNPIEIN